jgi:hypothetical protein
MVRAMRRLPFAIVLLHASAAAAAEPIDWTRAEQCVGEVCAVSGTVARAEDVAGAIRLYFDDSRRDVYVTLVRGWLVAWPDYSGRRIVATGPVRRFRDAVEVKVRDPDAIEVAGAPAGPDAPAEAPSPQREEVQELRDEIRRLEERVKELEGREE